MRNLILSACLAATALGATPSPATACGAKITRTDTFHEGSFPFYCSYWTYCYTLTDTGGELINELCVEFKYGTGHLDGASIQSPGGWTATMTKTEICWKKDKGFMKPYGTVTGFCVDTKCNPFLVDGGQRARTNLDPRPVYLHEVQVTQPSKTSKLYGSRKAPLGGFAVLRVVNAHGLRKSVVPLFAAAGKADLLIPGLGRLKLDPRSVVLLGFVRVYSGRGAVQIRIPNDPRLVGCNVYFQAADIQPRPGLSNGWDLKVVGRNG